MRRHFTLARVWFNKETFQFEKEWPKRRVELSRFLLCYESFPLLFGQSSSFAFVAKIDSTSFVMVAFVIQLVQGSKFKQSSSPMRTIHSRNNVNYMFANML